MASTLSMSKNLTTANNTKSKTIQVFSEDMTEHMRRQALEMSQAAFHMTISNGKVYSTIAARIRDGFDKHFGLGWNCIVGKSFGSCVTHEMKKYMYVENLSVKTSIFETMFESCEDAKLKII